MMRSSIEEQNAQSIHKLKELMSFSELDTAIEASGTTQSVTFTVEEEMALNEELKAIADAQAISIASLQDIVVG